MNKGTLVNGNGTVNIYSPTGELIRTDKYINGEKQE
ncbi:MAG: antitoxin component YwqK of YwqJK toxin-antitoxin module [Flavobacteriaceae bacterium]